MATGRSRTRTPSIGPRLVGVVHLPPLPGSPRARGTARDQVNALVTSVRKDSVALKNAGFDAIIVENFGDAPFYPDRVQPITTAIMTTCVRAVVETSGLPVGVNVLRNDAESALAIAAASGASFIRVNIHIGAAVADQGLIVGRAHDTLRTRVHWGLEDVTIWADVDVKHAAPLAARAVADQTHDLVDRGMADAVLVTGTATGASVDIEQLREVTRALGSRRVPVYIASGATPESLASFAHEGAHGVIVGSWIRSTGVAGGAVDARRARTFAREFHEHYR